MFELMNENEPLYQWDLNRKLYVADSSIKEVHFDTFDTSEALVVEVKEDGTAEIPNILLQQGWDITAYAYDSLNTLYSKTYRVIRRDKPANYVYTETELRTYEKLDTDIKELNNKVNGIISVPEGQQPYTELKADKDNNLVWGQPYFYHWKDLDKRIWQVNLKLPTFPQQLFILNYANPLLGDFQLMRAYTLVWIYDEEGNKIFSWGMGWCDKIEVLEYSEKGIHFRANLIGNLRDYQWDRETQEMAVTDIIYSGSQVERRLDKKVNLPEVAGVDGQIAVSDGNNGIRFEDKGIAEGVATLDASGKLVEAQLPVIKQAENANTINNNKLIKMTKAEYEAAVKEDNTIYLVYEAGV